MAVESGVVAKRGWLRQVKSSRDVLSEMGFPWMACVLSGDGGDFQARYDLLDVWLRKRCASDNSCTSPEFGDWWDNPSIFVVGFRREEDALAMVRRFGPGEVEFVGEKSTGKVAGV